MRIAHDCVRYRRSALINWRSNQQTDNEITQSRAEQKGFELDAESRKTSLRNQIPDDPTAKILSRFMTSAFNVGSSYIQNTTKTHDGSGLFGRKFS